MGISQEFQEVSIVVLEELLKNPDDFKKFPPHVYFYNLQMKEPEKYGKLDFDTNGYLPYCNDLNNLFNEFIKSGLVNHDNAPLIEPIKKYLASNKAKREK
ncbi:MAG: hypothetical protein AABY32_03780 [Nanoarchaeota archaeon]